MNDRALALAALAAILAVVIGAVMGIGYLADYVAHWGRG